MDAYPTERSGSFRVIQVLAANHARLAALMCDEGPTVGGKPVFPGYLFSRPGNFAPWHLSRPGVVTLLQGEVTEAELEIVRRAALARAEREARRKAEKTMLGNVGERVTMLGREFVLVAKRGSIVAVPAVVGGR